VQHQRPGLFESYGIPIGLFSLVEAEQVRGSMLILASGAFRPDQYNRVRDCFACPGQMGRLTVVRTPARLDRLALVFSLLDDLPRIPQAFPNVSHIASHTANITQLPAASLCHVAATKFWLSRTRWIWEGSTRVNQEREAELALDLRVCYSIDNTMSEVDRSVCYNHYQ